MREYTLTELFRLTRNELFDLHRQIVTALAEMPDNAPERQVAFQNLRNIRHVLAGRKFSPT